MAWNKNKKVKMDLPYYNYSYYQISHLLLFGLEVYIYIFEFATACRTKKKYAPLGLKMIYFQNVLVSFGNHSAS